MTSDASNEPPIMELVDKESVDILPYIGWSDCDPKKVNIHSLLYKIYRPRV